jgi:hypothetical protein
MTKRSQKAIDLLDLIVLGTVRVQEKSQERRFEGAPTPKQERLVFLYMFECGVMSVI